MKNWSGAWKRHFWPVSCCSLFCLFWSAVLDLSYPQRPVNRTWLHLLRITKWKEKGFVLVLEASISLCWKAWVIPCNVLNHLLAISKLHKAVSSLPATTITASTYSSHDKSRQHVAWQRSWDDSHLDTQTGVLEIIFHVNVSWNGKRKPKPLQGIYRQHMPIYWLTDLLCPMALNYFTR